MEKHIETLVQRYPQKEYDLGEYFDAITLLE